MRHQPKSLIGLILFVGLLFSGLFPQQQVVAQTVDPVITAALAYLQTQQEPDGGLNSFGSGSDPDGTARALLALAASGQPADRLISSQGLTLLDYLSAQAVTYTHDASGLLFPARAGLLLAAVATAQAYPYDFGGMDLIGEIEAAFHPETGVYSTTAVQEWSSGAASDLNQAWSILGLALAGQPIPQSATDYLLSTQAADGSWSFGDPDTTALAVVALLASGNVSADAAAIQSAWEFFHASQLPSGGWRPSWDSDPLNADTTGWVIQALRAAGEDPTSAEWSGLENNPLAALAGLQKPDGSIGGTYANAYSTADALIGLGGLPLKALWPAPAEIYHAGLVVQFGDGKAYLACIPFVEESLTGYDLLLRSGLTVESVTDPSLGTAVCKIEADGCKSENCFCAMPKYWSYWRLGETGWGYAATGAGQTIIRDGDVDGWSWGEGAAPPTVSWEEVCPAQAGASAALVSSWLPAVEASTYPLPPLPAEAAAYSYPYPQPLPAVPTETPADRLTPQAVEITPTTSVAPAAPSPGQGTSYLLFAVLALGLVGGLLLILRRRKKA